MLLLVNEARSKEGVPLVVLGDNIAAQLHAELSLAACTSSHWGPDGLTPGMRYALAGGFQTYTENISGLSYCFGPDDGYATAPDLHQRIDQAFDGWMDSEPHRRNILEPLHRKVSVGIAWGLYNFFAVQLFEDNYVEFDQLPSIEDGVLSFAGRTKNGAGMNDRRDLTVSVNYHPPPAPLNRAQLALSYCFYPSIPVAALRYPLPENQEWPTDSLTGFPKPCNSPYDVPPGTKAPESYQEARRAYDIARTTMDAPRPVPVQWVTASVWRVENGSFEVKAPVDSVLKQHGPGVYEISISAVRNGERLWISFYSIFHEIDPPDTYDPSKWDK